MISLTLFESLGIAKLWVFAFTAFFNILRLSVCLSLSLSLSCRMVYVRTVFIFSKLASALSLNSPRLHLFQVKVSRFARLMFRETSVPIFAT